MKKKIKLFATIATLCLSLAIFTFGVFSALTVTYKTTGTISYDIEDTYVEIETRIYSTSKKYDDEATLKAKSQEFETSTFTTLDALTTTGLVEGETTHDFNKVQIKNLDQGEDYTVQESDYKDTYSSVTATEAPEDLEVALKYQTTQGEDKGVYTYFVVTKLTNKSALPLYAYVPTTGDDKYVEPTNSNTYKLSGNKEMSTLDSEVYIVFAMSLNDITVTIDASEFTFPIVVTKDITALPEDAEEAQKVEHIAKYEVANVQQQETRTVLSSTATVVDIPFLTLAASEIDYMLINFHIKQTEQTLPANIDLNFSISAVMGTMPCTSYVKNVIAFNGEYKDIMEALTNLAYELTITQSSGEDSYSVTIPASSFTNDGTSNFTIIVQTDPYGMADMLYEAGYTDVQYSITSSVDYIEIITFEETVEWDITDYYIIGKSYTRETKNEDILQKLGLAYTLYNYQIRRLDSGTQKLNFSITSQNAEAMFILPGEIRHDLTINEIYAMSNNSEMLTAGVLNNQAQTNLPITLNADDVMDFCVCILYNAEQVKNGQDVSVTLSTSYELAAEEETSNLNYILAVDSNGKLYYDVVGMIDTTQSTVTIPAYHNSIPVTMIDDEAFINNQNITSVVFEDNSKATKIGYSVFQNCINLQTVNFGQNSKLEQISREAFAGCTKLESIVLPNSLTNISDSAFAGCSKLSSVTLSNNLKIISNSAFKDCTELREIEIPESVTKIYSDAFKGCINLSTIEIGNNVTDITYKAFNETPWYTANVVNGVHTNQSGTKYALRLPEGATTFDFTGIKVIGGSFASYETSTLTTITNLNSVEYICSSAFYKCTVLQDFDFGTNSQLKEIGQSAFSACDTLTTISIPYGVEVLYYATFSGCDNLKTVVLPNSLKTIGSSVFLSCIALTDVTIPSSVTKIEEEAFARCTSLTSIELPDEIYSIGCNIFDQTPIATQIASTDGIYTNSNGVKYAIKLTETDNDILDLAGVRVIADGYAEDYKGIGMITNLDDIVCIGAEAFRNTIIDGLLFGKDAKLEYIGEYAFFGCEYFFILVLPKTLTYMGYASVYEHQYIDKVYYGSTQEDFEKIEKKDDLFILDTATIYYYSETEPTQEGNFWRYVDGKPKAW